MKEFCRCYLFVDGKTNDSSCINKKVLPLSEVVYKDISIQISLDHLYFSSQCL